MKNNRIFFQIFIPILTLASIAIILISTIVTFRSANRMQQITDLSIRDSLQQLVMNVENDLTLMENNLTAFSTSSSYNQIVEGPLIPANLEDYRSMVNQIQYLEALNGSNFVEYSITSIPGKWAIINGSLKQLADEQVRQLTEEIDESITNNNQVTWLRERDKIVYKTYLPYFSSRKTSIAEGQISTEVLLNKITNPTFDNIGIISKDGAWLIAQQEFPSTSQQFYAAIQNTNQNEGIIKLENQTYYFAKNSLKNRLYVIQFDSLASTIKNENNPYLLFFISGMAILLISGTAFVVAKRISTPINKIKNTLSDLKHNDVTDSTKFDDLFYLADSIDQLINQQQNFSKFYEDDRTLLKNQFVQKLLTNQVTNHKLTSRLKLFDYPVEDGNLYFILITKIDYINSVEDTSIDIWYFGISKLIEETIDKEYIFDSTIMNSERHITILKINSQNQARTNQIVLSIAESIRSTILEILKLQVSIGISNQQTDLGSIYVSYQEAQQALQHKRNFEDSSIITINDVVPKGTDVLMSFYPDDIENRLKEEMLIGNIERSLDQLDLFFGKLQDYATNSVTVEIATIRLINSLLLLNQQLGLNRIKEIQTNQKHSIYQRVTEYHNLRYLRKIIADELIIPFIEENQQTTEALFKSLSEEIKTIIREQYDLDITLESIADDLHYNPNYLSNIFKKEVGISFTEYLNNYRLKMAKKLLIETDMPVKEIAEKLRYTNSQNFIRFFKKNEGKTPGAYRQDHSTSIPE